MKESLKTIGSGVLNSYAQLFFTQNNVTGGLLLLASMTAPSIGIWGLAGALLCQGIAALLRINPVLRQQGMVSYNGMLVSLGLAASLQVNGAFLALFGIACLLSVLLSAALAHGFGQAKLPSLSLAFVLTYWVILLCIGSFTGIQPLVFAPEDAQVWYYAAESWPLPGWFQDYLRSLGSILFEGNLVTGLLVAAGILWASRISFTLSILGFGVGYACFTALGGNPIHIGSHYIGFNFILTALAVGGFFFVANWRTYGLVVLLMPLVVLLSVAGMNLSEKAGLPVLSLPFVLTVPMVIYVLRMSNRIPGIVEVVYQQHSPEKNLYSYQNYQQRFGKSTYVQIGLPFFGEWSVYQGYNGKYTHKDNYRFAWDFVIRDASDKTFRSTGQSPDDYYGYNMPVVAPAAGYVVAVIDGVDDNAIGNINIKENWGNAVIIKHADYLYSKIAHLKKDSFTVKVGDYVRKGDVLAALGNSGRSPEPHIHFQLQATPELTAPTLQYPLAYYLLKGPQSLDLRSYDVPQETETIANIKTTPLLRDAFTFTPGQTLRFETEDGQLREEWLAGTTSQNEAYLHCVATGATAYFVNDGTMFYFSAYTGPRYTLLHYFYLAAHKVMLGYYRNTTISDAVPLHQLDRGPGRFLQDFMAPFTIYRHYLYRLTYPYTDNTIRPTRMKLQSSVSREVLGRQRDFFDFELLLEKNALSAFSIRHNNRTLTARQVMPQPETADEVPVTASID